MRAARTAPLIPLYHQHIRARKELLAGDESIEDLCT